MNENQKKDVVAALSKDKERKYYVYRLVDPRNLQTFYVGKGCGGRIFQHIENVQSLISNDESPISLKACRISEIIAAGKEVILLIQRWGLTEDEAFEVEAALIDIFTGLTNVQAGNNPERGAISVDDFYEVNKIAVYDEPEEDYVIIKTTVEAIALKNNSLYEASRASWNAKLENAQKYKYVLSTVYGIVREVYEVNKWYPVEDGRIAFDGQPATGTIAALKGKRIPEIYRQKGMARPFLYKRK